MLDPRAKNLLKTLIERYIVEGQPVGSRSLSRHSGLELSPATIRNVMADLEEMGLITSPHTSAGRVPTARGYRLFVDTLLSVQPLDAEGVSQLRDALSPDAPQRMFSQASQMVSQLTHFAGVVVSPRRKAPLIRQIEFISLADNRILLIIVTTDGEVQNRILLTKRAYSPSELVEAANYLTQNYAGLDFSQIRHRLQDELDQLRGDMTDLMSATIDAGSEATLDAAQQYVISGERNLLDNDDLSKNMERLRRLFDLFEQKTGLIQLLDISSQAEGVHVFIGGESGIAPLDDCSVVAAPYKMDGQVVGAIGVIGPTRMAYERVIPIVDISARLLSSAFTS